MSMQEELATTPEGGLSMEDLFALDDALSERLRLLGWGHRKEDSSGSDEDDYNDDYNDLVHDAAAHQVAINRLLTEFIAAHPR